MHALEDPMMGDRTPRTVPYRWLIAAFIIATALVIAGFLSNRAPSPPPGWTPPVALPRTTPLATTWLAFDSNRTGNFEVFVMPHAGGPAKRLTNDAAYDSWSPRISPDRRTILFYRTPAGKHDQEPSQASLWAMGADGQQPVMLRPSGLDGWFFQGHAEWSPDGSTLVMFGGSRINPQIFLTNAVGQSPRAVTNRPGTNLDPVFSSDGRRIGFVGCPQAVCYERDYEIYTVDISGGDARRITNDQLRDHDPMWSPDGRRLAWLTAFGGEGIGVWDVRIAGRTGASPRRLMGDTGVTSRPQFSRDGATMFVHRLAPGRAKFDVYRVNPDGSGLVEVTAGQPGSNEYPSP